MAIRTISFSLDGNLEFSIVIYHFNKDFFSSGVKPVGGGFFAELFY